MHNSILIIDEDRLFCDAFIRLAKGAGFRIAAICPDATVALARAQGESAPDIVLADLSAADAEGLRQLRAQLPNVRIAVLGEPTDEEARPLLRDVGPEAVLSKTLSGDALMAALALLMLDMAVLPRRLVSALPLPDRGPAAAGGPPGDLAHGLTGRETDILRHLATGDGNRSIAEQLGITESTVKMHCKSLLRKLGVPNRTQAALLAHRWGLAADPIRRAAGTSQRR